MSKNYLRKDTLSATTSAVSWTIPTYDNYICTRVALIFASAPTTSENVNISIKPNGETTYKHLLATADVQGATDILFENIDGVMSGDELLVECDNTDGVSISGIATFNSDSGN